MIRIYEPEGKDFAAFLRQRALDLEEVDQTVQGILQEMQKNGDGALCSLTQQFDGCSLLPDQLKVTPEQVKAAYHLVKPSFLAALEQAQKNITAFHRKQLQNTWIDPREDGTILGQMISPLKRVGIYVPGGKASYPSSVLMNAIPAAVAGVPEIVMVTPADARGAVNPHTLVAAAQAGVTEIYRVGGAQAVAALAYGTETIAQVDKITGPGNIYVTAAKRRVFGRVDIDMLAGPSEVLIVADDSAPPEYVAADMLAQAEHDEMASAVLVTNSRKLSKLVLDALTRQLQTLNRRVVAKKSLESRGAIVLTKTLSQSIELANAFAPEHLELMLDDPYNWLARVANAGAVFLGHYTPETVGDYWAGPNHVLPTGGTARFFSPLGVDAFMKKTSIIAYSPAALLRDGGHIIALAKTEGLAGHADAVSCRLADLRTAATKESSID